MMLRTSGRARAIEKAVVEAKVRDGRCLISGLTAEQLRARGEFLDAAHILPHNAPFPRYDPADPDFIFSVRSSLHREVWMGNVNKKAYDYSHKLEAKIEWLSKYRALRVFRDRLLWITDTSLEERP